VRDESRYCIRDLRPSAPPVRRKFMNTNPYSPPSAEVADPVSADVEYAGFWIRTGAALIDAVLIIAITYPVLYAVYGADYFDAEKKGLMAGPADFLISYILPAVASILFWLTGKAPPASWRCLCGWSTRKQARPCRRVNPSAAISPTSCRHFPCASALSGSASTRASKAGTTQAVTFQKKA